MLCGGVTTYSALRKSGATPGQYVALFGAGGGLGHLAVQMGARGMGLRVIGVDHSSKAALVRESGAEAFIAFDEVPDVVEAIVQASGGLGVHAAINLTPSMPAYDQGLRCLRFGGRLVAIGIPEGDMQPIASANAQTLIFKELSILGVAVGNRQEAIECLDMMARVSLLFLFSSVLFSRSAPSCSPVLSSLPVASLPLLHHRVQRLANPRSRASSSCIIARRRWRSSARCLRRWSAGRCRAASCSTCRDRGAVTRHMKQ